RLVRRRAEDGERLLIGVVEERRRRDDSLVHRLEVEASAADRGRRLGSTEHAAEQTSERPAHQRPPVWIEFFTRTDCERRRNWTRFFSMQKPLAVWRFRGRQTASGFEGLRNASEITAIP